jgi:hypothetical protein
MYKLTPQRQAANRRRYICRRDACRGADMCCDCGAEPAFGRYRCKTCRLKRSRKAHIATGGRI